MKKLIDLHAHTTASDGTYTPRELVNYAKEKGLSLIAITDHDTIDGVDEALDEGSKLGIEVIPGIEIGAIFRGEMHLLGYFKSDNYKNINLLLNRLKRAREDRNIKIINKLNELGFDISINEVKTFSRGKIISRTHMANLMVKKGYVKNMDMAFDKYLGEGKCCYFKKSKINPEEGIKEIINAGGIPVLAHPIYLHLDNQKLGELLQVLKAYGLVGIEIFYADHTNEYIGFLSRLAQKIGLLPTGGSDFHGANRTRSDLGVGKGNLSIDYSLYEGLIKEYIKESVK